MFPELMADPTPFVTCTHEALFLAEEPACDVCGRPLPAHGSVQDEDDDASGNGSGLYVWTRGGEVHYEEPPLCATCATAIRVSAMARWEIEEEEG
jgi:hypothetical protein